MAALTTVLKPIAKHVVQLWLAIDFGCGLLEVITNSAESHRVSNIIDDDVAASIVVVAWLSHTAHVDQNLVTGQRKDRITVAGVMNSQLVVKTPGKCVCPMKQYRSILANKISIFR